MTVHEKLDLLIGNGGSAQEIEIFHLEGYKNSSSFDTYYKSGTSRISNFTGYGTKSYGTFDIVDFAGEVKIFNLRTRDNKDKNNIGNIILTINDVSYNLENKQFITVNLSHIQTIRIDYPYTFTGYFGDVLIFAK